MAKTNANAPAAPVGPWRSGRPSFKAFYPEIIFLTIVTIAFIALAARLSCAGAKPKSENAEPTPVSSATLFSTEQAFAQDASLDALLPIEEETTASQADEDASAPSADFVEPVEAQTETEAETVATLPSEAETNDVAPQTAKNGASAKILAIWIVCLAIPALLWIWRAWNWLVAVYGVKFEIRCDADNPKATTFLVTRGIFNKKTDSLHIAQVKDIQSSQTFIQKYFQGGVGTIRLFTQDLTDGVLTMKNMEDPSRVFNALDELRRRYWALGGIGGMGGRAENEVEMGNVEGINDAM
ncbi:MAG: PH domain-containing protein [Thermoguttaceae bacterium]|nr:PH domain-containing protein [Thermoguttaceae bacterium]